MTKGPLTAIGPRLDSARGLTLSYLALQLGHGHVPQQPCTKLADV